MPDYLDDGDKPATGMTFRDCLAAQALPAVIAAVFNGSELVDKPTSPKRLQRSIADISYCIADAMLAARDVAVEASDEVL